VVQSRLQFSVRSRDAEQPRLQLRSGSVSGQRFFSGTSAADEEASARPAAQQQQRPNLRLRQDSALSRRFYGGVDAADDEKSAVFHAGRQRSAFLAQALGSIADLRDFGDLLTGPSDEVMVKVQNVSDTMAWP
jgi:hypothetical protein